MKSIIIAIIFIASVNLSFSKINSSEENMFLENVSPFNFSETVDKLNEQITEKGWKLITTHDLQETLKKNGKDVLAVKVIATCNPNYAYKLLSNDEERIISSMLPCRISVYEKSDGKTYISRMNAAIFAKQLGGLIEQVMIEAFNDTETMISTVIK